MIPTTTRRSPVYTGTGGGATAYAYAFKVFADADVRVVATSAAGAVSTLVQGVDYTISRNADQDNFPGGAVTTSLATGTQLVMIGSRPLAQTAQFPNGGGYNAVTLERALDSIEMQVQQLSEQLARAVQLPATLSTGVVLPVLRASKAVIFDADGNISVSADNYVDQLANVTTQAGIATAQATIATAKAAAAASSAASIAYFYPGTYVAAPLVRPDGSARQAGDAYFNSTSSLSFRWNGATWVSSDINTANLAASGGTALLGWIQAGANAVARTVQDKLRERSVSVADFAGCDPTGATSSDAAFISALTYVASLSGAAPAGVSSNAVGKTKITIPSGFYKLTASSSMLNSALYAARTSGLLFEGDGPAGSVIIIYDPVVPGPMLVNNDKVLYVRFKNLWFHGKSAASNFLDSTSSGGAQDYVFEDCLFSGTWQYGVNLTGTNVNSEIKFDRCSWSGSWLAFLYTAAASTSDQFLNYWFLHCKYWCASPWIDMSKGGSIKLTDCDVSAFGPAGAQAYLFNLRGNGHSRGVTSFHVKGLRVEQGSAFAGIIYSEWEQGSISFDGCDFGSQAFNGYAAGVLSAHFFQLGAITGALVSFTNCTIMGQHKFTSGGGPFGSARALYENCEFVNYTYQDDAFIFVNSQAGRQITVKTVNCRGNGTGGVFADADIGWQVSANATITRKLISFRNAFGALPTFSDGTVVAILPLNAIITRAIIVVPAGAVGSAAAAAGWVMQTSDGTALTSLSMTPYNAGGSVDTPLHVRCLTRARATIQLIPNASTDQAAAGTNGAVALVEYIG